MTNKEKYIEFCNNNIDLPIFFQYWWLDASCGRDNWGILLSEKNNNIRAVMPITYKKIGIFTGITNPLLTPRLGIWFNYPDSQKYTSKLSFEKEVINDLLLKLPKHSFFSLNFNEKFTNWLPFYWNNYQQTTKYSYVISKGENIESVWRNLKDNIRREIRKAEKKVKISTSEDINNYYEINKLTFKRQNKEIPYSLELLKNIDDVCKKNNCRKILIASDGNNNVHATIYLIWDNNKVYYLMGGGNPKLRTSGATSLIMWKSIKFALQNDKDFDFEGSMIEPIERFFRSFGAKQVPYFKIMKYNSSLLKFFKAMKM